MSMKPRLNDGPVNEPGLVSQCKTGLESKDLPASNLSSCTKPETPTGGAGFDNLSSKARPA